VELEIPSAPEYVSIVRRAVEGIAQRMNFQQTKIDDLKVAVGEACTNAIKYGCPMGDDHNVGIKCVVETDGLSIEIKNNINDCIAPTIPLTPSIDDPCGRGIFLMHQLMDEVDFRWENHTAVVKMLMRLQ